MYRPSYPFQHIYIEHRVATMTQSRICCRTVHKQHRSRRRRSIHTYSVHYILQNTIQEIENEFRFPNNAKLNNCFPFNCISGILPFSSRINSALSAQYRRKWKESSTKGVLLDAAASFCLHWQNMSCDIYIYIFFLIFFFVLCLSHSSPFCAFKRR